MVNINNVAIFVTFFTDGKNQLNFAHVLIKMHPTTMGNKPMLIQNFDEQPLFPRFPHTKGSPSNTKNLCYRDMRHVQIKKKNRGKSSEDGCCD